ncbi:MULTISPECIES: P-loop NTPase family protein [Thiorhodovibrio]|uniref:shikimate kinase n=1 Tax=Thiorhodovibrio TaxID=61593 RepID=UPI00191332B8|nr:MULTISPECIES: shikimate kinase [Thiorhodovibrio]MBK5969471.1 shikimate kinase [Thiorhodovibrio winogradskyi]WPL11931.1 topology modulation protein [Thiorhodovibrio litoralis]
MKVVLFGNAGSGKSTLSKKLLAREPAACLSLDAVAFEGGPTRRPLEDSIAAVQGFIAEHDSWIIEGCYADILEPILADCEDLLFLNPGIEACVAHCRMRPWEPEKYPSPTAQNENLANLIDWVRSYETREDEYGLHRHRQLYHAFRGNKREYQDPSEYGFG